MPSEWRRLLGQEEREPSAWEEVSSCATLTWKQRVMGFAMCFCLGVVLSLASTVALAQFARRPEKFAILYSLGNLLALFSTAFLVGPWKQLKNMFDKTRVIATLVYLACLGLTLWYALFKSHKGDHPPKGPILVFIIIQMLALSWYSLSYIPYARKAVASCFRRTIVEA